MGTLYHIYLKGETTMKVNPRTVKIILDFVAAFALAASGVIVKDFLTEPEPNAPKELEAPQKPKASQGE